MKNNIYNLSLCIAILLFSTSIFAQNVANANSQTFTDFLNIHNSGVNRNPYLTNEEIDGSAYLNDEFTLGSILTKNNNELPRGRAIEVSIGIFSFRPKGSGN